MTKKLVFMNHFEDWGEVIPGVDGLDTLEAYQEMTQIGKRLEIEIYITGYSNIDPETALVNKAWNYDNKKWIKLDTPFKPDLIISKIPARLSFETFEFRSLLSTQIEVINDPGFSTFIGDKFNQYLIFPQLMLKTVLVKNIKELTKAVGGLKGKKIVFKKSFGSGGSKVKILNKNQPFDEAIEFLKFPFLVQEFINSSKGIPGFDIDLSQFPIVADLRMMFIGSKFIFAVSRIAQNSLFTNVSLGAKIRYIEQKKIPESAMVVSRSIAKKLSIFGKNILAIDLMFDDDGKPIVIEINTKPDPVFNNCAPIDIQEDYLRELFKEF